MPSFFLPRNSSQFCLEKVPASLKTEFCNKGSLCQPVCAFVKMDLRDAAEQGNLARVQLLLGQGTGADETDRNGYTALWLAACEGHLAIVQCLVEQGADKEKVSRGGGSTPLNIASGMGHVEVVRYLLEQGADRDKADISGYSPLHWAAWKGHLEIAMLLMSYGADLNARNEAGELPIDVAHTEKMRQAIRDEPRRRMDHGHKRATEQDRHPNAAATSASAHQDDEREALAGETGNKKPRIEEGEAEETKVAEEDEDSEPSSDEEEDN